MADEPPLLFVRNLGGLYPSTAAGERVIESISGTVEITIKRTRGNNRRLGMYWAVLARAAPVLSDLCKGDPLTDKMLHRVLKRRKGLVKKTILPSGEESYDDDSISFSAMTEDQRSEYVTWAFATISKWLGISVEALTEGA